MLVRSCGFQVCVGNVPMLRDWRKRWQTSGLLMSSRRSLLLLISLHLVATISVIDLKRVDHFVYRSRWIRQRHHEIGTSIAQQEQLLVNYMV